MNICYYHTKRKRAIESTFSIIQSKHGISININLYYIKHKKLKEYIPTTIKVPFPLCPNFEMTLFASTPLEHEEYLKIKNIHHGTYNYWTGVSYMLLVWVDHIYPNWSRNFWVTIHQQPWISFILFSPSVFPLSSPTCTNYVHTRFLR